MKRRSFTLVEIMIIVAIIALLSAMAIPNLLKARLQTNESAAQATLKTIAKEEATYRSANPTYATLMQLGAPGTKNGYNFAVGVGTQHFVATAVPAAANVSGGRSFCITEDGIVRRDAAIVAGTDHDTCQGYSVASP